METTLINFFELKKKKHNAALEFIDVFVRVK